MVDKLKYRRRRSFLDGQPGPGSYSLELRRERNVVSFTHSKRFITDMQGIPGPGAYKTEDSLKERIKAGSLARSSRTAVASEVSRPGPSDYDVPALIKYKKKQPAILYSPAYIESERQRGFCTTTRTIPALEPTTYRGKSTSSKEFGLTKPSTAGRTADTGASGRAKS
jgi:hypothetical protein